MREASHSAPLLLPPRRRLTAKGDYYGCVPPDPGIAAAALRASESGTLPGTAPAQALHTFMLDSGASRCFFRESTTLTPLPAPIPVRLADPSGGPVVARSSSVLACPACRCPPGEMATLTTPGGQRVSICTCTRTGRHLATFTHRPGSSLYTLATEPPHVDASAQVSASGQVAASYSCRLLSHQTLLWHRHMGHPPLPHLRGMHSRLLVSGLPRSLPPLPPCLPCVEGWQRAAPHSSSFPPTTAPLHTLHMDVWGPARVSGQSRERYFLLVVDDYTRYTTVFPLRSKGEVVDVLIPWICTVRLQLREWFGQDLPVLHLHYDRGGEFSSNLWPDFCRREGILQSFTLSDSPQQNGIAERRIGLVMELNLWPHVSLPETSPTLRWTGEVGDASVFRVWGSCAFVCDTSVDKLSARAIPCVFLGFVPDAPGWQFYHPTSRRVLPSQDVTFDESVPFYRPFPYRSAPPLPPPLFLAPGPPPVDPLPPQGPAPSGVSQVDPLPGIVPVKVAIVSSAAPGAASWGAASGGAEPGGEGSEGAGSGGAKPGARLRSGAPAAGGAGVTAGAGGTGGTAAAGPGGARTRGGGATGTGGVGGAGVGDPTEPGAAGDGGSCLTCLLLDSACTVIYIPACLHLLGAGRRMARLASRAAHSRAGSSRAARAGGCRPVGLRAAGQRKQGSKAAYGCKGRRVGYQRAARGLLVVASGLPEGGVRAARGGERAASGRRAGRRGDERAARAASGLQGQLAGCRSGERAAGAARGLLKAARGLQGWRAGCRGGAWAAKGGARAAKGGAMSCKGRRAGC
ncbi:unnamed protein product [Closterium sp. NIES-54]